ncbi:hypothetical protein Q4489_02630 [Thalassotalea sp. 1_MG-2023]|uniref:hypothetical protein n=1 Tax=Thalassotalea sp. 1_MG-2023 TaxID=3062680 RepID=UPI0026E3B1DD|nr:hypothetical protein [Thalassotalea sp. 1_MG-2023]MDO6425886.1 hypothetical protein [Thalassotalea sp. 1_MG-2023]
MRVLSIDEIPQVTGGNSFLKWVLEQIAGGLVFEAAKIAIDGAGSIDLDWVGNAVPINVDHQNNTIIIKAKAS